MSTFSQRLTAFAAVITALLAGCILLLMWGFISAFSETLDEDNLGGIATEISCVDYAGEVLDLHATGYSAKQITDALGAGRGHEGDSYLFTGCGTPREVISAAGPVKK